MKNNIYSQYSEYILAKRELVKQIKVKKILSSYAKWFNKKYNLKGKTILDFGSLIESDIYTKFLRDNGGKTKGYKGFDIDDESLKWLKSKNLFFDVNSGETADFDYIFMIDVYEHLDPNERIRVLALLRKLLKKDGELFVSYPYMKNLNYFVMPIGDWTHKNVDLEFEIPAFVVFGGFKFENISSFIGGWTVPFLSPVKNVSAIIRNLINLFPPFHVAVIIAKNEN